MVSGDQETLALMAGQQQGTLIYWMII